MTPREIKFEGIRKGDEIRARRVGARRGVFVRAYPEGHGFPWHTPRDGWAWSDFDPDTIEVLSEGIEVES